jgi:hypothetical protein
MSCFAELRVLHRRSRKERREPGRRVRRANTTGCKPLSHSYGRLAMRIASLKELVGPLSGVSGEAEAIASLSARSTHPVRVSIGRKI